MPTLETIRRLKVEATTTGVAQTAAELQKLSAAQADVAKSSQVMGTVTEQTSRKQLSVEAAYKRQTLALDETARKQDQFAKASRIADQALAQGVITQQQHAERLSALGTKYEQASVASKAFANATSGLSAQVLALSAGAGPLGIFLAGLGPAGLAAAIGLGAVSAAIGFIVSESNRMGDKAIAVRQFSEATGLTAAQFKGIRHEAASFGIEGDTTTAAFERLTFQLDETRQASGKLFEEVREVDAGLADQLSKTTTTAEAIDLLAQAYKSATSEAQKMAIARAAFGRQGAVIGPALGGIADAGGIAGIERNMHGLSEATDAQNKKWAIMRAETIELRKHADNILASIFTEDGLKAQREAAELSLKIANAIKEAAIARKALPAPERVPDVKFSGAAGSTAGLLDASAMLEKIRSSAQGPLHDTILQQMATQAQQAGSSLKEMQDAASAAANKERELIGLLGEAATVDEKRIASLTALTAAFLLNKFGAQESAQAAEAYNRAIDAVNLAAQIQKNQALIGVLGSLASVQDLVTQKELQIAQARQQGIEVTKEQTDALLAQARAQAELAAVAPGTYERQLAALQALKAAYPGLTAAQAQAAHSLEQQLALAQAVTGQQKMMAQAAIDYQAAIDRGMTTEQASAEATRKHAIAVAQVTAAAQAQLLALRDQFAVASAVTGAAKMRAEAEATINQLLRDGVEAETAMAVAAQQLANAVAAANTAVAQQIHSLEQELEVLKATTQEAKDRVLAEQAYQNAIDSGADVEHAMALQAATAAVSEEKRRQAEETARLNALEQQRLAVLKQQNAEEQKYLQAIEAIYSGTDRLINQMQFNVPSASGGGDAEGVQRGGIASPTGLAYNKMMEDEVEYWKARGYTNAHITGVNTSQLYVDRGELDPAWVANQAVRGFETQRVQAQIAGDKGAEIRAVQGELGFYQSQPQTLENLQQIKSLMDALKQLTDATNDNTAATASLSDIYSSGHSARIGYYNEGTTTAVIGQPTIPTNTPVWGNPITTPAPANNNDPWAQLRRLTDYSGVPHFAEGGTVTRPTLALVGEAGPEDITPVGKRGGPPTVVQNFNIMMPARSDLGDRSTQRQMFEGIGRRAAVAR